jgi:hypothetical protein
VTGRRAESIVTIGEKTVDVEKEEEWCKLEKLVEQYW